ncbi:MAG: translesion error-prone DNA polymerase V autoproteolytic subunit [Bacteroidota bacterium]
MPLKKINREPLQFYVPNFEAGNGLPMAGSTVRAGFPSPALDFMEYSIDLNKELSRNDTCTFYIRVEGNSMVGAGIDDGDILVADRSLEPEDGCIAICLIDAEFTVKRLKLEIDCLYLVPENPDYPLLRVTEYNQFLVWGIVTYVIKKIG